MLALAALSSARQQRAQSAAEGPRVTLIDVKPAVMWLRQIVTHVRSALVRLAKGGWCFSNRVDVRVGDEKRSMSSAGDTHGLQ